MVNDNKPTPIERMAALLAEMTERAENAERQRDAAQADVNHWYQQYIITKTKLTDAEEELAERIKENEALKSELAEYIENLAKGVQL